jgi:hypothetical protein
VNGLVDDQLRALLRVPLSASRDGARTDLAVWIDTAFNGGLAIPRKQVAALGLVKEPSAEAVPGTAGPSNWRRSPASSIGSAAPTRRKSPPVTASTRCSGPCCWTATGWTSTPRRKRLN